MTCPDERECYHFQTREELSLRIKRGEEKNVEFKMIVKISFDGRPFYSLT